MLESKLGVAVTDRTRAQRFELQIPLRYRADGGGDWHTGTTRNISRSGALFQGEEWAEPLTPLEVTLQLPSEIGVGCAAEVVCRGTVTRSARGGIGGSASLIAIKISHYRLVRAQGGRRVGNTAHA